MSVSKDPIQFDYDEKARILFITELSGDEEGNEDVSRVIIGEMAYFVRLPLEVDRRLSSLSNPPTTSATVYEMQSVLGELRKAMLVLACDWPSGTNGRTPDHAAWFQSLQEMDTQLAEQVLAFVRSPNGIAEYVGA